MTGALAGLRVVDFGQYLPGPLVAVMLADQGAEVTRVDPPGGPRWRHAANAMLQRGKRSMVLNLKHASDREVAQRLVSTSDVVVENFRPGVMDRLGLGPDAMLGSNPGLIYCSLPGFGSDDERALWPGWEGVVESAAGLYLSSGRYPDEGPVFNARPVASGYAAFMAAHAIVAALIARRRDGLGQRIEVPLFDASFEFIGLNGFKLPGPPRAPIGDPAKNALGPLGHYRCKDGKWIHLCLYQERHVPWFTAAFLDREWADTWLMDRNRLRTDPQVAAEVRRTFEALFATRTAHEWERAINEVAGVPTSVCQTTAEWLREDVHARDSGAVIALDDPEYGPTHQAGYPVVLEGTPACAQGPRHVLDADRPAVLAELQRAGSREGARQHVGATSTKPLAGMRVIDLTQVLAGPTAGRVLAEYGAEVVKINGPQDTQQGRHPYTNSGKRTMLLNLKAPEGMQILWRLVRGADVFVQNFARGVPERMGIGETHVRQVQPHIVYATVSAFGYTGWRGGYRGREELGQAVTGAQLRWGGEEAPTMEPYALNDFATGHLAAFAILLGIYHRLQGGAGQHVHASLAHSCTYLQIPFMIDHAGQVWDEPSGQRARGWSPRYRLYAASDRWFFLAAQRPGDQARLAHVAGLQDVAYLTGAELERALEQRFINEAAQTWVQRLLEVGLGAHVLSRFADLFEDDAVKRRKLSIEREHAGIGRMRTPGPSKRLWRTPVEPTQPAPAPGWHSREIVDEIGWGERFDDLVARGVVAEELPGFRLEGSFV